MYTLFIVLIVLASLLMIFIVLIQESKGGGLASNFSSTNSIMGVRKTTNFVEKATWGLAGAMVVFSIVCAYTAPKAVTEESVLENTATQQQSTNAANTCTGRSGSCGARFTGSCTKRSRCTSCKVKLSNCLYKKGVPMILWHTFFI